MLGDNPDVDNKIAEPDSEIHEFDLCGATSNPNLPACGLKALEVAALGYHPVPVVAGKKMPIAEFIKRDKRGNAKGFDPALQAVAGIIKAWTDFPDANLALSLTNLIQVDLDTEKAVSLFRSLGIPRVPTFETPKSQHGLGGVRMLFKYSTDLPGNLGTKMSGKRPDLGLEWSRGSTMIGLIAPSIFNGDADGRFAGVYKEIIGLSDAEPLPLADFPELIDLLQKRQRTTAKLPKSVKKGERNTTLSDTAALWHSAGLTRQEILTGLTAINEGPRVQGRLADREVKDIVKSAMNLPAKPWSGPACEIFIADVFSRYEWDTYHKKYANAVFRVLLNRCDENGVADPGPSLESLGDATGSRDGARYGVAELERVGLLERTIRGPRKPTRYKLWLHARPDQ